MFTPYWQLVSAAAVLALLVLPGPSRAHGDEDDEPEIIIAPARAVRDHEGIFSPEARARANVEIAEVRSRYKTDLVIETRQAPDLGKVEGSDEKAVHQAYEKWLGKHAKEMLGEEGILISIFPEEKMIFCMVGAKTQKAKLFSIEKARQLPKKVEPILEKEEFDLALEAAVAYVRAALPAFKEPPVKTDGDSWFMEHLEWEEDEPDEPAAAPVPQVLDHANIFSVPARVEANSILKELKARYKFHVVVESHGVTLRDLQKQYPTEWNKSKDEALKAWLRRHAQVPAGGAGFALVFLPRLAPPRTFVWIGRETFKASSPKERKRVVEKVRREVAQAGNDRLRAKDHDGALQAALQQVQKELGEHPLATIAPRAGSKRNAGAQQGKKATAPVAATGTDNPRTPWLSYLLIGAGALLVFRLVMARKSR